MIKQMVQNEVGSAESAQEVLQVATEIEAVKEAAEGEITVSEPETEVPVEAATKAPTVITDEPAPSPNPSPSPSPGSVPSPSPSSGDATKGEDRAVSSTIAMQGSTFMGLVIATLAAMTMQ